MGAILTQILRENSAFMFRWMPWLFDLQYALFMHFAPTRWLSQQLLCAARPPRVAAADPRPQPRRRRLHLPGRHAPCSATCVARAGSRFRATRRSPTSRAFSSGPTRGSTFTSSPTRSQPRRSSGSPGRAAPAGRSRRHRRRSSRARSRAEARRTLGLPAEGTVIAVSGGGWGVGDLHRRHRGGARGAGRHRAVRCAAATTRCARASRGASEATRDFG